MLSLGLGLSLGTSASSSAPLPAMAYESEATAVISAWTTAGQTPSVARKYQVNRFFKRLKDNGFNIANDFLQIAFFNHGVSAYDMVNWATPGTMNPSLVGTPTAGANLGWTGSSGNYIESNVPLSAIPRNSHAVFLWSNTTGANGGSDCGAVDGSSNGFTLQCQVTTTNTMTFRSSSAAHVTLISSTSYWGGSGFHGISRSASNSIEAYKNPYKVATLTDASVDLSASSLTFQWLGLNNNGSHGASARQQAVGIIAKRYLTVSEVRVLHDAVRTYVNSVRFGEIETYAPGVQPASVTKQHIVYGCTPAGAAYAIECAARGETVAIVASFRERTVGSLFGMSANGLGAVDLASTTAFGGLSRQWIENSVSSYTTNPGMQPETFHRQVRALLDGARVGGYAIPVYFSNGLASVAKTGTAITSFTTKDGRTFTANEFHDATYAGELMVAAGCDYIVGREAAGGSGEASNGYRGPSAATSSPVDPYLTPGNAGSGFVFGVESTPALSVGDLDPSPVQAMNFRLTFTTDVGVGYAHTTNAPPDYTESRYELVGRAFAAGVYNAAQSASGGTGCFTNRSLPSNFVDFNNNGYFSSDYIYNNAARRFLDALYSKDYTTAEAIWQEHRNFTLGLVYYLARTTDVRISSGIKTEMLGYRWPATHYYDRDPNDEALEAYIPGQLYQRGGARLIGDYIHTGTDCTATDGTTPRSTNTGSMFAYDMDSHAHRRIVRVDTAGAVNEGGLDVTAGGVNNKGPLPIEICLPKAAQITNLSVSFAVSTTHLAFCAARMEMPAIQSGQSCAVLATLARGAGLGLQAYLTANAATYMTQALLGQGANAPVLSTTN